MYILTFNTNVLSTDDKFFLNENAIWPVKLCPIESNVKSYVKIPRKIHSLYAVSLILETIWLKRQLLLSVIEKIKIPSPVIYRKHDKC